MQFTSLRICLAKIRAGSIRDRTNRTVEQKLYTRTLPEYKSDTLARPIPRSGYPNVRICDMIFGHFCRNYVFKPKSDFSMSESDGPRLFLQKFLQNVDQNYTQT